MLRSLAPLVALAWSLSACGGARGPAAPCPSAAAADEPEPRIAILPSDEPRFDVPVDGRPAKGAEEALVTIVEITDFECPFCSRVQPTLARLLDAHPEARLVVRQLPLPMHRYAVAAGEAALAAYAQGGDAAFFRVHDVLFANQHALAPSDLELHAEAAGLDLPRFRADLEGGAPRALLVEDARLAESLGVTGTPTFFINGRKVVGALPFEELDAIVREELAVAEALVAQGVPRARVYDAFRQAARLAAGAP